MSHCLRRFPQFLSDLFLQLLRLHNLHIRQEPVQPKLGALGAVRAEADLDPSVGQGFLDQVLVPLQVGFALRAEPGDDVHRRAVHERAVEVLRGDVGAGDKGLVQDRHVLHPVEGEEFRLPR